MELSQTLLFVGAMLVAFQYVGDIGYVATLFSMPFALPLNPLMKKLGIGFKRESPSQLGFQIDQQKEKTKRQKWMQIIWWILFLLSVIIFFIVSLVTLPIMIMYLFICKPLIGINKLLNIIYKKAMSPWDIIYLVVMQQTIHTLQNVFKVKTMKKTYSDKNLLKIRAEKGELPFLAFIGLLCIVTGFVLQLLN